MKLPEFDIALVCQSYLTVQLDRILCRIPSEVSQCDKPGSFIAARDRVRAVSPRKHHAIDKDSAVPSMKIINSGQFREFIIAQQPRVTVYLRGQNQAAVESLKNQIIFPVVETR